MGGAWAFSNRNDLDRTGKSVKVTEALTSTFGSDVIAGVGARYAKITELIEGETKIAKGMAVKWDAETSDWVDNEDGAVYDYDTLTGAGDSETTVTIQYTNNITSPSDLNIDQIVRLQYYPGLSDTSQWLVLETGAGSSTTLLDIQSVDSETGIYTGAILDNPTDQNEIATDVLIKTLEGTSNTDALLGIQTFSSKSYTEDIPEDELEEPTEEEPNPPTTRLIYYIEPPIIY